MAVNILIVDDSMPMRAVIIKTIRASGYGAATYFQAENGQDALVQLRDNWLDLVVTDYNMPDMNGLDLIKEMKKDDVLSAIPVIVVTTEGSQKKIEEFMEQGAAGYVKKAFTPELIRKKLAEILGEMSDDSEDEFEGGDDDLDF